MCNRTMLSVMMLSAVTCYGGGGWTPASELTRFSKKLRDGSTIVLEYEKYAETITKFEPTNGDNGRIPRESRETTFRSRLVRMNGNEREVVWERFINIWAASGLRPRFIVKDVELFNNRLHIVYAFQDGYLNLTTLEKDDSGRWNYVTCSRLDDRPRSLQECQLIRRSDGLKLLCFDPHTPTAQKGEWDVVDGVLRSHATK